MEQVQESDAIRERTPGEKRAYVEGYAAGIKAAAALARIYEGQSDIGGRVERAGKVTADLLEETIVAALRDQLSEWVDPADA